MTDSRLSSINQMILACIFGVGLLLVIFALLFWPSKPDTQALTIVGTLLTTLGTVVVMQNTHFFKSGSSDTPGTPGITPLVPLNGDPHVGTQINAQTVYHGGSVPPVNPVS